MAFGRVKKLDPVALNKRHAVQKKSKECTEEELIDSGICIHLVPFIRYNNYIQLSKRKFK